MHRFAAVTMMLVALAAGPLSLVRGDSPTTRPAQPAAVTTQPSEPVAVPAPQPVPPPVPPPQGAVAIGSVRNVEGEMVRPMLLKMTLTGQQADPGELTVWTEGRTIHAPMDQIVRIVMSPAADADRPALDRMPDNAVALLLSNGDWLAGLISGGDERQVQVAVVGLGEISVPLRRIRGVVAPAGRSGQNLNQLERILMTDPPATDGEENVNDQVRLANGETVAGTVVRIDPKGLVVQGQLGELSIGYDVLMTAQLANATDAPAGADRPCAAWVELANGSRLLAEKLQWDAQTLRLHRPGQPTPLLVAGANVLAVEVVGGRWRWLDALTPVVSEHRPFLTVRWPARFGVNVAGGPLRIGERTFNHGIGVHSASRLVFATDKARQFHCLAGMDAAAGPLADVDIQVLVDGKVKFERKGVKAANGAIPIDVALDGAQKLELRVDFGANGDVQDRFNWADAALIR